MNREELERLTKPELIELLLGLQRPDKTSRTSSKPPSTDRKGKREGSRPGGAKPGHKGHARALAETADAHEDHRPAHCQHCGLPFGEDAMDDVIGEYDEIDLPEVRPIKPIGTWEVMIKDHHEGYVGWDEYERNQKQLALNNYGRAGGVKSGRGGKALLSGIMTCGRCGRRLSVAYTGNLQSRPVYRCQTPNLTMGFVQTEFVDRGMIADLNVHWDIGADGLAKPHAHVMLTMREVGEDGFGPKNRDWNATSLLENWRERWGEHVNERLAELDIDARVDHRSLEAQGIDLEPQHKIGPAASRMAGQGLTSERLDEHVEIARANGDKIIANPEIALDAITRQQATFTRRDLAMFVHRHSEGQEQFDQVIGAVRGSPELVALGKDGRGDERFTSRDMIATEQRLESATSVMVERDHHGVADRHRDTALARAAARGMILSGEQRSAYEHVTEGKGLGIVIGYAGTGKSVMLGVACEAWESAGYQVHGLALSGIAAENLESGSGIASRTIASMEHQWDQGRELLDQRSILVIDEAGMIGSRQMERVVSEAEKRGAKVVLVGDPEQLQAIEAGAAFRATAERHAGVEITEVRRQHEGWQREATRQLATGLTGEAIDNYAEHDMVHAAATRDDARADLVDRWDRDRQRDPSASRIILTHTRKEVEALNDVARGRVSARGVAMPCGAAI